MTEHVASPKLEKPAQVVSFPSLPAVGARKRGFGKRWLTVSLGSLLVLACVAAAWWFSRESSAVHYTTVPATRGAVTRTVTATGTVNPVLTIIVGTYVSGVIRELYCDYNTQVRKGQVCAKIDPRPYQAVVNQYKATLAVAKAQLEKDKASLAYTKITSERYAKLVQEDSTSLDAADNAKNLYAQAQAQIQYDQAMIEQDQAELEAAQVNLDYTDIVSPVDGTVVSRNVTMGQTVAASFQTPTLFLIATDLTKMQVDTNVSESDVGGIKEGKTASFTVDAFPARTFDGVVSQFRQSPQTVQNVVTFDVVVSVDNADLALKPGVTAATRIVTGLRTDVIRVPNQALRYKPGGVTGAAVQQQGAPGAARLPGAAGPGQSQVWVLRDGHLSSVPVTLGLDDDSFTEIAKGDLRPGDQVITGEQRAAGNGSSTVARPRL
ncbi:MAG: efflux RND transporter periplasmic adaptor subunit [Xanthobacteraceae bacterium]